MPQVYRVFPDYSADPVWDAEGMVDLQRELGDDVEIRYEAP